MENDQISEKVTYSVIILLEEINDDFVRHARTLCRIFKLRGKPFEVLIVANGLDGFLQENIPDIGILASNIQLIALNKKVPQAVCLKLGFKESHGDIIVACGSYQQISENSFGRLLDALEPGIDIISPWRKNRVDPTINQLQSKLFNVVVRKITGSKIHDLSCSVKVFRRAVLEETILYGNMYRFLPIVAERNGFRNLEVEVNHFKEYGPVGFFGFAVYFTRLIDILTLYFNAHFTRKPLRFFSSIGLIFFLIGLSGFCYVIVQRLFMGIPIGGRAVMLLSMLFIVIGVQVSTAGLLGEIIAFIHGRQRKDYTIAKII
jgi:hypothetical protein